MKRGALSFIGAIACVAVQADASTLPVEQEARSLIGVEFTARVMGAAIAPHLTCTNEGGGGIEIKGVSPEGWSYGRAVCQGRSVAVLKRAVGQEGQHIKWRIVDAVLLPRFELDPDPKRPNAPRLLSAGECELDGRTDTSFIALVRWGKHERVDWRTGVEQAWGYDPQQERIVSLSTKRIVCWRPEPA
ncbi:hypothetical protein M8A51_19650 [Schlegelella sp. S2-27]|uniref:Uncharacterized protein n=1 Tax=Caldimonas mangrovi TaxID=2944811 RepID=A0ABT0YT09_9BURK|nr:hypothetical protein [Caldimonas mangrovi]MCM5681748.1 hypothetical protein [Caldimonas mangrovi]